MKFTHQDSQPTPTKTEYKACVDELIERLNKRKELGISRYGVALTKWNGRNSLQDVFEEMLDMVIYMQQVLDELEDLNKLKED